MAVTPLSLERLRELRAVIDSDDLVLVLDELIARRLAQPAVP